MLVSKGSGSSVSETKAFKKEKSVFLDSGHDESDPGAMAVGYTEAGLNLSVIGCEESAKAIERPWHIVYLSHIIFL